MTLTCIEELLYLQRMHDLEDDMTDENQHPGPSPGGELPPPPPDPNTTPADLKVSECCKAVMYLGDRVKTLESELSFVKLKGARVPQEFADDMAALEKVVHQMAAQLVQRGWFHGVKNAVTDWYERLRGKHGA